MDLNWIFDMASDSFTRIKDYIQRRMRMSHIYQPVMLMELLKLGGTAHKQDIATAFLSFDQSQVDYYQVVVGNMPGKVLRKNGMVDPGPRGSGLYSLKGFESLNGEEVEALKELCQVKLEEYIEKRGQRIWAHRDHTRRDIPGTIRYEVLKRAQRRCELCGVSDEVRALEVDHIVPKSLGGPDSLDNYQALCDTCNAQKGNKDDTDFRGWEAQYAHREEGCLFCELPDSITVLAENELARVLKDNYPVSPGHCLIIPKRHVTDWFSMNQAELNACNRLLAAQKARIEAEDAAVTGFNLGANCGGSAGQSVFHAHIHLIPRRDGDQDNPRGGVRRIFPEKADY